MIGHTSFFFEPQDDPGLDIVESIGFFLEDFGLAATDFDADGFPVSIPGYGFDDLRLTLEASSADLDPLAAEDLSFAIEALEFPLTELHQQVFTVVEALDLDQILANSIADVFLYWPTLGQSRHPYARLYIR